MVRGCSPAWWPIGSGVRRDDAAVVYYCGHGLYATNRDRQDELQIVQAIAPTDLDATTGDDFRSITAWELAIKLAQLTAMTRNVTVLLDCCHAAQMTRDQLYTGTKWLISKLYSPEAFWTRFQRIAGLLGPNPLLSRGTGKLHSVPSRERSNRVFGRMIRSIRISLPAFSATMSACSASPQP